MNPLYLVSFLIFVAGVTGAVAVLSYWRERSWIKIWRARLDGTAAVVSYRDRYQAIKAAGVRTLLRIGGHKQTWTLPESLPLPNLFATAGLRRADAPALYRGVKLLSVMLLPPLALIGGMLTSGALTAPVLLSALMSATAGWVAPEIWLRRRAERRQLRIQESFADAVDLMVVCVEAGLGLDAAVTRVGQEIQLLHRDLADELHLLSFELRSGRARQQAFRNFSLRVPIDDIRSFVAVMIQTERFGTSIGQALRMHSQAMRQQRRLRAREQAAKLPVKLLGPLIFCILPSLFLILLGPAVIRAIRVLLPTLSP